MESHFSFQVTRKRLLTGFLILLFAFLGIRIVSSQSDPVIQIAAGNNITCSLTNGEVRCWGIGAYTGTQSAHLVTIPKQVPGINNGVFLAASGQHACVVLDSGGVACWGNNTAGELGDASTNLAASPVMVSGLGGYVQKLGLGFSHSCAILSDKTLQCWGLNANGQVGSGVAANHFTTPQSVTGITNVIKVVGGGAHTCALLGDGSIKCWGYGFFGQLGNGNSGNTADSNVPVNVINLGGKAVDLAASYIGTCALLQDGRIRCWGLFADVNSKVPVDLPHAYSNPKAISMGVDSLCALDANGTASCMGLGGVLGEPVDGLGAGVTSIAAGHYHACALKTGEMYCWGSDQYGALGSGQTGYTGVPLPVMSFYGQTPIAAASGGNYNCASTAAGKAYCWGSNSGGNLGIGDTDFFTNYSLPQPVSGLSSGVSKISAGTHTCAVVNGAAKCWGRNLQGQLGVSLDTPESVVPVQVTGLTSGVSQISVTSQADNPHTCAVVNGAAKCWGFNYSGQLGLGYISDSSPYCVYQPGQVVGLTSGVTDIASGGDHSCAVVNGSAKCWGFSYYGQLGNGSSGTYDKFSSPVQVVGLTSGVTAIETGRNFSCAIVNGGVKCWGAADQGQIGDGTAYVSPYDKVAYPTGVSGMGSNVTALALGPENACAIKNGEVWCWGSGYGLSPVKVPGISEVLLLSGYYSDGCAIRADGLYCWGDNSNGQLGDGKYFDRPWAEKVIGFSPQQTVTLNNNRAKAGSVLHLVGAHFPADAKGWLEVNGNVLGEVYTDSAGQFSGILLTNGADDGYYKLTVNVELQTAWTDFILDSTSPLIPQEGTGSVYQLLPGIVTLTPRPTSTPVPGETPAPEPVEPSPLISSIVPTQGDRMETATIHVYGDHFKVGAIVKLDGNIPALSTEFVDSTHLVAVLPGALSEKYYDITVLNPDWKSGTKILAYAAQSPGYGMSLPGDDLSGYNNELTTLSQEAVVGQTNEVRFVVHRLGGSEPLSNVRVRFYVGEPYLDNPAAQANLIGDGIINTLGVGQTSVVSVSWTPQAAGVRMLYALIDPGKQVIEFDETNNTFSNWIEIKPAAPPPGSDLEPPVVDSVQAPLNTVSTLPTLHVEAHDIGSAGVRYVDLVIYEYFQSTGSWLPVDESGWLPYTEGSYNYYEVPMGFFPGARWVEVWVADASNNISYDPFSVVINYIEPLSFIMPGESHFFLYPLYAGEQFTANMGFMYPDDDADLYLWPPQGSPWVSAKGYGVPESLSVTVPSTGYYWLEVFGYDWAVYNLSVYIPGVSMNEITGEVMAKPQPVIRPNPAGNWPTGVYHLDTKMFRVNLPIVIK